MNRLRPDSPSLLGAFSGGTAHIATASIAAVCIWIASVATAFLVAAAGPVEKKVIYEAESKYNHIIVKEDEKGLRYLLFSETGGYQSVAKPGDADQLQLPYSHMMLVGLASVEEPAKILIIGLGGGSIPAFLHKRYPKTRIDCVDIDPEVIAVARVFFGFKEDETLKAHAADGRKFIEETAEQYDLIFLDAFGNDFVPRHLTTKEFLTAVRRILAPGGIVLGNVWSRLSNPYYDSMIRTYKEAYEQVYIFKVPERENIIVLAVPRKGKITKEELAGQAEAVEKKRSIPFDLSELVRSAYRDAAEIEFADPVLYDEEEGGGEDSATRRDEDTGRRP